MSPMFNVQKGVPLPEINRAPKGQRRKYPIETMAVGDMFFVPHRDTKSVSAYISRISKGVPGKFSARHCWMDAVGVDDLGVQQWELAEGPGGDAIEGTGVWRTE